MSADPRGYYRILRVAPSASSEQIKQAYRALAKALHPDLNRGEDTTQAFQAVN
jgi:molecular chaperone DnaJ